MDNAQAELNALISEHNKIMDEATKAIRTLVKTNFSKVTNHLFDIAPEIKAIAFYTWTPGFNDGNPCTFTIGDISFHATEEVEIDDHDGGEGGINLNAEETLAGLLDDTKTDWLRDYYKGLGTLETEIDKLKELISEQNIGTDRYAVLNGLRENFNNFLSRNSEYIESLVGNDTFAVITRGGIHTEEYECGY